MESDPPNAHATQPYLKGQRFGDTFPETTNCLKDQTKSSNGSNAYAGDSLKKFQQRPQKHKHFSVETLVVFLFMFAFCFLVGCNSLS